MFIVSLVRAFASVSEKELRQVISRAIRYFTRRKSYAVLSES